MEREQRFLSNSHSRDAKLILATAVLTAVGTVSGMSVLKDREISESSISSNPADFRYEILLTDRNICYSNQLPDYLGKIYNTYCPTMSGKNHFTMYHDYDKGAGLIEGVSGKPK